MSFAKQYPRVNVVGKGHRSFTVTHTTKTNRETTQNTRTICDTTVVKWS